jgi:hypothetical protein
MEGPVALPLAPFRLRRLPIRQARPSSDGLCGSRVALQRIVNILVEHSADAARAAPPREDCHVFETYRGSVVDEALGAICVIEPASSRCLWFVAKDFAPADN